MRLAIYIGLLIFLIAFYAFVPGNMNKETIAILLLVVLGSLILFFSKKEKNNSLKGQALKHSTLVLIGLIIVFFQYPLDFVLGNVSASYLYIWVNKNIVIKCIALAIIGLLCFIIGYLVYKTRKVQKRRIRVEKAEPVNILNLLAGISLITYFLTVNPLYLVGFYGVVNIGPEASYAIMFFQIFIYASVIQKCRNLLILNERPISFIKFINKLGWPIYLMIGVYLLSVMISGDRGPLMTYGVLLVGSYTFVTKFKIKYKYLVLFVVIGVLLFSALRIIRKTGNKEQSFAEKIINGYQDNNTNKKSISPSTIEFAASLRTLNTAVNYVPNHHPYFYGRFQSQQILRAIPFFGIFYPLLFNSKKYERYEGDVGNRLAGSAQYITWIRQGDYPLFGDGTSCMADFYLDFGLIGVILGMFFFGYLMRLAEINMYDEQLPSLFAQVFFIVYLSLTIYMARSSLFAGAKTVVWIYVILTVNKYIFRFRPSFKRKRVNVFK